MPALFLREIFDRTYFGLYLQDDWRWKPNLTLNLGLRYEMSTVPSETSGKTANLANLSDPLPICGTLKYGGCSGTGAFFNNPTLHNFEPRVGFAWDPFRNGKTAVRGGIGMFDVLPLPYQFVLMTTQSAPFFSYTSINNPGQGTFYNGLTNFPNNTLRSTYVQHAKRDYVIQWNFNIQQQITPSVAAMVAYVGSRGIHQPFKVDEADLVIPSLDSVRVSLVAQWNGYQPELRIGSRAFLRRTFLLQCAGSTIVQTLEPWISSAGRLHLGEEHGHKFSIGCR